jgi:hypothetical protein
VTIALYADQHVPAAITKGLRQRGVDVLTAQEDGLAAADDEAILERARELARLVYTNDDDFLAITHRWLRVGHDFAGLAYAHPLAISVRQAIENLEVIAKVADPADVRNMIYYLPF